MNRSTYYITRRDRWSHDGGPDIYQAEWEACVNSDGDLQYDGSDADVDGETVRWDDQETTLHLSGGNIVCESTGDGVLPKLLEIAARLEARVMDREGVVYVRATRPGTGMNHKKRVIPRAAAALLLSVVGLVLLSAAMLHLFVYHQYDEVTLRGASFSFITPPLVGVGTVAIIASILLAVSSLYPWDRRWSKFAVTALILDVLPLLFVA